MHRLVGCEDLLIFSLKHRTINMLLLNIVIISRIIHAFWLVLSYGLLEEKRKDDVTANNILLLYLIKQIDSVLLWVCIVIDHRRSQNVVKHW